MILKFYETALDRLRSRREVFSNRLLEGSITKLGEYKFVVGKYKGLNEAEIILKQLYRDTFNLDMETGGTVENERFNDE